jgi:hypothetical protein
MRRAGAESAAGRVREARGDSWLLCLFRVSRKKNSVLVLLSDNEVYVGEPQSAFQNEALRMTLAHQQRALLIQLNTDPGIPPVKDRL